MPQSSNPFPPALGPRPRDDGRQPATEPLAPLRDPFLEAGGDVDPLRTSLQRGAETPPDTARRVLQLQQKTGLPTTLIEPNLAEFEKLDKWQALDVDYLRQVSPGVAAWLAQNPLHPAATRDEVPRLQGVEQHLGYLGDFLRAVDRFQGSLYALPEVTGELLGAEGIKAWGKEGRQRNELEARAYGDAPNFADAFASPRAFGDYWARTIIDQIPNMGASMAAGAAIGSVVPGAGTVLGVTVGAFIGAFVPSMVQGVGEMQSSIKDLDPNAEAPMVAILGGSAIGFFDAITPGQMATKLTKTFGKNLTEKMLRELLLQPVKPQFLIRTAKGAVTGMVSEAIPEALQQIIEDYAAAYGSNTATPDAWTVLKNAGQAGFTGGLVGFATEGAVEGATTRGAQARWAQARMLADQQEALGKSLSGQVVDSETFQQLPERMRAFVTEITKDGPVTEVSLPVQQFEEYFQARGDNPAIAAAAITGRPDALAQAKADKTDLRVPIGDFVTKLAGHADHAAYAAREAKYRPDIMNRREVDELFQRNQKIQEEVKAKRLQEHADLQTSIAATLTDLFVEGGLSRYEAQKEGALHAGHYVALAHRLGVDPGQLLADEPLEVITTLRTGQPLTPLLLRAAARQQGQQATSIAETLPAESMTDAREATLQAAFATAATPVTEPTATEGDPEAPPAAEGTPREEFVALDQAGFSPTEIGAFQAAGLAVEGRMTREQFTRYTALRAERAAGAERRARTAAGVTNIPPSPAPAGETAPQRTRRTQAQVEALVSMLTQVGQTLDPALTADRVRTALEARLGFVHAQLAAVRESGRGQALLRAIAAYGGLWRAPGGAAQSEVTDLAREGRDIKEGTALGGRDALAYDRQEWEDLQTGTQTRGVVPTWAGVAGVFRADGLAPEVMAQQLAQEGGFGNIDGPTALFDAIDVALRAEQEVDAVPGTEELGQLGIDPLTPWWESAWGVDPAVYEAERDFEPLVEDTLSPPDLEQRPAAPRPPARWTRDEATAFVNDHADAFSLAGFDPEVVGSVATRGQSDHDVDILLAPLAGTATLEDAIESFVAEVLPQISDDVNITPLPSPEGQWFMPVRLRDGRLAEFYFPQQLADDGAPNTELFQPGQLPHGARGALDANGEHMVTLPGGGSFIHLLAPSSRYPLLDRFLFVADVFVPREERRDGQGRRLYEAAVAYAQALGYEGLSSYPASRNEQSDGLWRALAREGVVTSRDDGAGHTYDVVTHTGGEFFQRKPPEPAALPTVLKAQKVVRQAPTHLDAAPAERKDGALLLSTRSPKLTRNVPEADAPLVTNLATFEQAPPEKLKQAADLFRSYDLLPRAQRRLKNDATVLRHAIEAMKLNLRALWDRYPPEWRERSKLWYVGANRLANDLARQYRVYTVDQVAGVMASLSPQKDWFQNVNLAERVLAIYTQFKRDDAVFSEELFAQFESRTQVAAKTWVSSHKLTGAKREDYLAGKQTEIDDMRALVGRPWSGMTPFEQARFLRMHDEITDTSRQYRVITPEGDHGGLAVNEDGSPQQVAWGTYKFIEKAIRILDDGSAENISRYVSTKHKVRSFFNNISHPWDARAVTIDTHAVGAAFLQPFSQTAPAVDHTMGNAGAPQHDPSGLYGTNGIIAQAYFELAAELGVLPRELQSVTWEAQRSLYRPEQKRSETGDTLRAEIASIVKAYGKGQITHEQFVDQVFVAAAVGRPEGAFAAPGWADAAPSDEGRMAAEGVRPRRPDVPAAPRNQGRNSRRPAGRDPAQRDGVIRGRTGALGRGEAVAAEGRRALRREHGRIADEGEFFQASSAGALQLSSAFDQFYSRLALPVRDAKVETAKGRDWKAIIRAAKTGINQDEYAAVGVDALNDTTTYSRAEVLDYLTAHQVRVEPVELMSEDQLVDPKVLQVEAERIYAEMVASAIDDATESDRGPRWLAPDAYHIEEETEDGVTTYALYIEEFDARGFHAGDFETQENAETYAEQEIDNINRVAEENFRLDVSAETSWDEAEREAGRNLREGTEAYRARYAQYVTDGAIEGSYRELFLTAPHATADDDLLPKQRAHVKRAIANVDVTLGSDTLTPEGRADAQAGRAVLVRLLDQGDFSIKYAPDPVFAALSDEEIDLVTTWTTGLAYDVATEANRHARETEWVDGHGGYEHIKNPIVRIRYNVRRLPPPIETLQADVRQRASDGVWQVFIDGTARPVSFATKAQAEQDALARVRERAQGETVLFLEEVQPPQKDQTAKVPALFQAQWQPLALRWALQEAAVKGYDRVAWTNGEMQMERWPGLRQEAQLVRWYPARQRLVVNGPDAAVLVDRLGVSETDLAKHVGEATAQRLLTSNIFRGRRPTAAGIDRGPDPDPTANWDYYVVPGEGLHIGGEGLMRLYDRDLGVTLNKLPVMKRTSSKATTMALTGMVERRVYTGPTRTRRQLIAEAAAADPDSPLDSHLADQRALVVEAMGGGATFEEAMVQEGSIALAELYGGQLITGAQSATVPGVIITPTLRDALRTGGQEFFQAGRRRKAGNAPYDQTVAGTPITVDPMAPQLPTRVELVTQTSRTLPVTTVQSAADAAAALGYLARGAQERFDGLVTDAEGRPLALVGGFKGTTAETAVYGEVLLAEALNVPGAARIVMAHNHPSGNPTLSPADHQITRQLRALFQDSGVQFDGLLAIGAGAGAQRHWQFTPDGLGVTGAGLVRAEVPGVGTGVPVQEREFVATEPLDARPISTPDLAATIVPELAQGRFGVVLVDTRHVARGFVPLDPATALALKDEGRARALYQTWAQSGTTRAFVYAPTAALEAEAMNVANALHAIKVEVLDLVGPGLGHKPNGLPQGTLTGAFTQADEGGEGDAPPEVRASYNRRLRRIKLIAGAANFSSMLHESGHVFLDDLFRHASTLSRKPDAELTDLQRGVIRDAHAVLRWFNFAGPAGDFLALSTDEQRSMHEQWARAFEVYLFTGQAPSAELRSIFATFRVWLTNIYTQHIRPNLVTQEIAERAISRDAGFTVSLPTEIREVMDRLLATDEAIAAAKSEHDVVPLFTDQATAGVDDVTWLAYQASMTQASQQARADLDAKLLGEWRRAQGEDWERERASIHEQVLNELSQNPIVVAQSVMRTGLLPNGEVPSFGDGTPMKLSKDAIVAMKGAAFLQTLPKPYLYQVVGGHHPDAMSELLGFASGEALLDALVTAPNPRKLAEQTTEQRLHALRGDQQLDGVNLKDVAEQVIHEHRGEVIAAELHALTQGMTRQALPSGAALKAAAEARVAGLQVRELHPGIFLQAATRSSRRAYDALGRNDRHAAVQHKIDELSSLALYRAAAAAKERAHKSARLLGEYQTSAGRRRGLLKAGKDYLDQVDDILERYEFTKVSQRQQERRLSMRAWADKEKAKGQPVDIPESMLDDARVINYTRLTVDELEAVRQTVEHISHLARLKRHLVDTRDKRELDEIRHEIATSILTFHQVRPQVYESKQGLQPHKSFVGGLHYSHLKLATIIRLLDGGEDGGPLWQTVMRRINEAATLEAVQQANAASKLQALFEQHYSARERYRFKRKIAVPQLSGARGVKSISLTKEGLLLIALNQGNEQNAQRLRDGYGWTQAQVDEALNVHLDKRDRDFVQGVWDYIDEFWPAIVAKQERIAGAVPEKVQARPVSTRFGEYRGGYFPIMWDGEISSRAQSYHEGAMADMAKAAAYAHNVPAHGHMERRVEGDVKKHPMRLDFGVITDHTARVVHDLTHHEMLIDVGRILDPMHRVGETIQETLGVNANEQLRTALRDIALGDVPARNQIEEAIGYIRNGTTVVGLGWNTMSAVLQWVGLTGSVQRIGFSWTARGLGSFLRGAITMQGTTNAVMKESAFMRSRFGNFDIELSDVRKVLGLERGIIAPQFDLLLRSVSGDRWTKAGLLNSYMSLIGRAQRMVDVVTYLGAKTKAAADPANRLENGLLDDAKIIALAEQTVIDSQGSGHIKDLASVQRGGPAMKAFLNFYSYFNVVYNQAALSAQVNGTKLAANPKNPAAVSRMMVDYLLLVTAPVLLTHLTRSAIYGTLGDEDDEDKFLTAIYREHLSYMAGTMVLAREFSGYLEGRQGYDGPAGTRGFGTIGKTLGQVAGGDFDLKHWRGWNQVGGTLFHYPAGQVERTTRGIQALMNGETEGTWQTLTAPVFGVPPKR